jgi:hypothetical protein
MVEIISGRGKRKILVIADGKYPKEIDSINYFEAAKGKLPNIAEYDVVIIDLVQIDTNKAKVIMESPQLTSKCFHNLLWSKHELILISDGKYQNIESNGGYYQTIFYNLPILVTPSNESGNTVIINDPTYKKYYEEQVGDKWNYYLDSKTDIVISPYHLEKLFTEKELNSSYPRCWLDKTIANNGFNRPVSFSLNYGLHNKKNDSVEKSGPIIFLQAPYKSNSVESAIKILLENYGVHNITPAPSWVSEIRVPGEEFIEREIKQLLEQRTIIDGEILKKESEKKVTIRFKKLLFETGDELRNIVWETFEEIGFSVDKNDIQKEDGSIKDISKVAVLEVKGREKSLTTDDARQLDDWITDYTSRTGTEPIGLLIGNHYRLEAPTNRVEPYPNDVIRYVKARSTKMCLMTTLQLFKIYCDIKNGKLNPVEIRKKIMENSGIFNL